VITIQLPALGSVAWWYIPITAILCFFLGVLITRRFGTNWLAVLSWLVGDPELEVIARIAWNADVVPATLKRVLFKNDEDYFVKWVLAKVHGLNPQTTTDLNNEALKVGFASGKAVSEPVVPVG
jgi:hypothetical protein